MLIGRLGGEIRYGATVDEITVDPAGGRPRATGVRLESGAIVPADVVVSNADAAWTYRRLIRPEYRRRWTDDRLDRVKYSMSLLVWYFGTRRRYEDVAHHTILLGPRYGGLLDRQRQALATLLSPLDVGPRADQSLEALAKLKPYFDRRWGTVTIGNSCQVTDGAVALLVMDAERAKALGYQPLGKIRGYAYAGCDPSRIALNCSRTMAIKQYHLE